MVQIPEPTEEGGLAQKAGYKTICDIGEERIRRAGKKIKEETGADIDYGFRCFKVDSSNMKDVYYHPAEVKQDQISIFEDNIEYSGVKSITCPAIGNHHSGQTEISIPEMEITNILS